MRVLAIDPGGRCTAVALVRGREAPVYASRWFNKKKGETDEGFSVRRLDMLKELLRDFLLDNIGHSYPGRTYPDLVVVEFPGAFSYERSRREGKGLNVHSLQVNYAMALFSTYCIFEEVRAAGTHIVQVQADLWKKGCPADMRGVVLGSWGLKVNDHEADAIMLADWGKRTRGLVLK